ncbi:LacI family DNA-binding transcriptional regulator [Microlunatus speluncae]|uniref:LacI family DNA-binding transcriptional regulator n=1 Tax=Microlunatus speluncae TaxID=2594267 RepID=UPI0012664A4F|nr:substrate-binding domain-containing protein [Microlunatus speluncae]
MSRDLAHRRRQLLLELLRVRGAVKVSELAPELGVSEMTVRRDLAALADRGLLDKVYGGATLVEPDTTFHAALEPAPAATQHRRRFTIGMVVPSFSYYWPAIIAGARSAADAAGARLLLRSSSSDLIDDRKQISALACTPGVDALIAAPGLEAPGSGALVRWLEQLRQPVMLAERRAPASMLEWAVSDHAAGAAMAVRHLHDNGHRRIGLFAHDLSPTTPHIQRGWSGQLRALDLDPAAQLGGPTAAFTEPGRDRVLDDVVADLRRHRTTAVIVHSDPPAQALVQHCIDLGMRIPDDLEVVTYDDEVAQLSQPSLTAVRPPKHHVGRVAVECLVARLQEGSNRPVTRVVLTPELIIRQSSPRRDRAAGETTQLSRPTAP